MTNRADTIVHLPIDALQVDEVNPREFIGDIDHLAVSIREVGVITPLIVRPSGHETYGVLAGSRRLMAAQQVGLDTVPCEVRDDLAETDAAILAITENVGRENLNPIEEAHAFQRLMDEHGLTHREIAERCGVSNATVAARLSFLEELDEDEQEQVGTGVLGVKDAYTLAKRRRRERAARGGDRVGRKWWVDPDALEEPEANEDGDGEDDPDVTTRRRQLVAELLRTRTIATVRDLLPLLRARGHDVSWGTLQRDLDVLGARKVPIGEDEGEEAEEVGQPVVNSLVQARRDEMAHRHEVITGILREHVVSSIDYLVELLFEHGVEASFETVRQDLGRLGAQRYEGVTEDSWFYAIPCPGCGKLGVMCECQAASNGQPSSSRHTRPVQRRREQQATAPSLPSGRPNPQRPPAREVTVSLLPDYTLSQVPPGKVAVLLDEHVAEMVERRAKVRGIAPARWLDEAIAAKYRTEVGVVATS
jgi:ParB/RepB/Spo0J family partition protein